MEQKVTKRTLQRLKAKAYAPPKLHGENSQLDTLVMLAKPPAAAATDFVEGFEREQTLHKYLAQAAPLRAQRKKQKQEEQK